MTWQDLVKLATDLGGATAPIFALMWWLERSERIDNNKLNEDRAQRRDAALTEVRLALATLAAIFNSNNAEK